MYQSHERIEPIMDCPYCEENNEAHTPVLIVLEVFEHLPHYLGSCTECGFDFFDQYPADAEAVQS